MLEGGKPSSAKVLHNTKETAKTRKRAKLAVHIKRQVTITRLSNKLRHASSASCLDEAFCTTVGTPQRQHTTINKAVLILAHSHIQARSETAFSNRAFLRLFKYFFVILLTLKSIYDGIKACIYTLFHFLNFPVQFLDHFNFQLFKALVD